MSRRAKVKPGIFCPVCRRQKPDVPEWLKYAVSEFYSPRKAANLYRGLNADLKKGVETDIRAINVLGHFQEFCDARRHPKKPHICAGLVEVGLFQAVELLNRGLFHLIGGAPSPALSLFRMATEVGVRAVFEQILYAYLRRLVPSRRRNDKFATYLRECRRAVATSSEHLLERCSMDLHKQAWPDVGPPMNNRVPQLDPGRLGWTAVTGYLRDARILTADDLLTTELDKIYETLSVFIHQRASILEAGKFIAEERFNVQEAENWIIRGVPPVPPTLEDLDFPRRIADLLMALVLKAQRRLDVVWTRLDEKPEWWFDNVQSWKELPLLTSALKNWPRSLSR